MKCELCHKNDAQTAVRVTKDGEEEELYVCEACAKETRARRQKKSQRTRKISRNGVEMTVTEIGPGNEPPPIVKALMSAFGEMLTGGGKTADGESAGEPESPAPEMKAVSVRGVPLDYKIGQALHLEGLYLIGEMEAVRRAVNALGMEILGTCADGVRDAGHVFYVRHSGDAERAKRVVEDLVMQERNARVRLFEEMPRVFGDSLCRALAVLKNCRLLSPGELFDLLSPLRLGAAEKMLDGITKKEIDAMISGIDLTSGEDSLSPDERDRVDAERADEQNKRFEDVVLNERGEEKFL